MQAFNHETRQWHATLPEHLARQTVETLREGRLRCIGTWQVMVDLERRIWLDPESPTHDELTDGHCVIVQRTSAGVEMDITYVEDGNAEWLPQDKDKFYADKPYAPPTMVPVARLIDMNEHRNRIDVDKTVEAILNTPIDLTSQQNEVSTDSY